jgi:hypothetical protein
MNTFNAVPLGKGEVTKSVTGVDSSSATQYRSASVDGSSRVTELELENSRLHRLVAELLIKNQQLRKQDEVQG